MTLRTSAAGGGPAFIPPFKFGGMARHFAFLAPDGGEGGGGSGGGQGGGEGGKGGEKKPFMVFESQDDLDDFVEKRLGRERRKLQGKIDDLETQLEAAKGKGDQGKGKDGERVYTQAEVDTLVAKKDEEITTRQQRIDGLLGVQRKNAILEAATNAYNPAQVAKLLESEIGFDDQGNLIVLDDKGNHRLDPKNGKPLSVATHVTTYLEANKHLVKGSQIGGTGSGGGQGGGGNKPTYTQTQISDPTFYAANRADIIAAANEGRIVD